MTKQQRKWVTRAMLRGCPHPVIVAVPAMADAVMVLNAEGLRRDEVTVVVDDTEVAEVLGSYRHPMAELNRRVDQWHSGARQ